MQHALITSKGSTWHHSSQSRSSSSSQLLFFLLLCHNHFWIPYCFLCNTQFRQTKCAIMASKLFKSKGLHDKQFSSIKDSLRKKKKEKNAEAVVMEWYAKTENAQWLKIVLSSPKYVTSVWKYTETSHLFLTKLPSIFCSLFDRNETFAFLFYTQNTTST